MARLAGGESDAAQIENVGVLSHSSKVAVTTSLTQPLTRRPTQHLGGLVLLGRGVRFATLGVHSLAPDEAVTADTVRRSLGSAMSQVPHTESTPPLYFFVAWVWAKVFG